MKKSLHNEEDFEEIKRRIMSLDEDAQRKWGRMSVAQMLEHCRRILKIATEQIRIQNTNFFIKRFGALAKYEMKIFNSGIPHNMPTFQKVIVNFECDFTDSKNNLLKSLDDYILVWKMKKLPFTHPLFGDMTGEDWGFLEYKHLDHHLKQFDA